MIAPEPGEGINSNSQTTRLVLLRNNLIVSALIFAALQIWRHCFFLTDDNFNGLFPFFTEMGHHLLAGQSPFVSDHLFGGHYNLLRDPAFSYWHPLYLLSSLLAATPFHLWIIDADAFGFFMLATAGFVMLAHHLRKELGLTVSDGWIMFYTMSFTYSMISLAVGASWLNFLGNHSALPWLVLGILQKKAWRGLGLIILFSVHQVLGGHFSPTISCSLFLTLFAIGISISRRSFLPLGMWVGGYIIAVILLLPLLIPMAHGFLASTRAQGVRLDDMQMYNLPIEQLLPSIFLGSTIWMIAHADGAGYSCYVQTTAAFAAAWCLLPAMISRGKWRGLDVVIVALILLGLFLIHRPLWLANILMQIPILRAMRWPFRELIELQFFLHLFLLVRPPGLTRMHRMVAAWWGTLIFVIPMLFNPLPPTFNSTVWDRELVLSDGFRNYWDKVRPLLRPNEPVAVLIPVKVHVENCFEEPYSLLPSYSFSVLADLVNVSGYSPTAPSDQMFIKEYPYYPFGAYLPEQKAALLKEQPNLNFITLQSLHPLKITLSIGDGPETDLTPYIPPRKNAKP